jgi:mRNA interferase MazF
VKQIFYAPQRGDVVRVSVRSPPDSRPPDPRLFLVLSPQTYNSRAGLALLCPITAHVKGYPFEVLIPEGLPVKGAVLADQAESLDWRARRAEAVCALPWAVVGEVLGKLQALLERPERC